MSNSFFRHIKGSKTADLRDLFHLFQDILCNTVRIFNLDDIPISTQITSRRSVMDRHELQSGIAELDYDIIDPVCFTFPLLYFSAWPGTVRYPYTVCHTFRPCTSLFRFLGFIAISILPTIKVRSPPKGTAYAPPF